MDAKGDAEVAPSIDFNCIPTIIIRWSLNWITGWIDYPTVWMPLRSEFNAASFFFNSQHFVPFIFSFHFVFDYGSQLTWIRSVCKKKVYMYVCCICHLKKGVDTIQVANSLQSAIGYANVIFIRMNNNVFTSIMTKFEKKRFSFLCSFSHLSFHFNSHKIKMFVINFLLIESVCLVDTNANKQNKNEHASHACILFSEYISFYLFCCLENISFHLNVLWLY